MDGYPSEYLEHNFPLVILSGLGPANADSLLDSAESTFPVLSKNTTLVKSILPPVGGKGSSQLLKCFLELDAGDTAWNGLSSTGRGGPVRFRIRTVGREYEFPPRKASRLPTSPLLTPAQGHLIPKPPPTQPLHSPLSPLSPGSPTFPDGIMTPFWVRKHQQIVPSAYVTVNEMTSEPNLDSLRDNQLKIELNNLKRSLNSAAPKTRFTVVLLGDKPMLDPDIDERLKSIRRGIGLESKSSVFYLARNESLAGMQAFAFNVLLNLQPTCIEYYRDLSKHARRKKSRGFIPPPTAPPVRGTSQTLALHGWNVRYSFKAAVFAEFRQDMDAAGRDYEVAYEGLLGKDVIESVASWSSRFNDARLLADTIAIRLLRCLLWNAQATAAVQSWVKHRDRIKDLVDRRGKGSANYGWKAWEARWATVMAEVVQKAKLPIFAELSSPTPQKDMHQSNMAIYSPPEKAIPLSPFFFLHHPGYWLVQSAECLYARRALAEQMPEEDRVAPSQSPASHVSRRHQYDAYLCPEPHIEFPTAGQNGVRHSKLITDLLALAATQFHQRSQRRNFHHLLLDIARECSLDCRWNEALEILRPLWNEMTWREEGWWCIVEDVGRLLLECARQCGDGQSIVSAELELTNDAVAPKSRRPYSFDKCLDGVRSLTSKPTVVLADSGVFSFLTATHSFRTAEGHVGEPGGSCQLLIRSNAYQGSEPIILSEIRIAYEGPLECVILRHQPTAEAATTTARRVLITPELRNAQAYPSAPTSQRSFDLESKGLSLVGRADLGIFPGQSKIFNYEIVLREAGQLKAINTTLVFSQDLFKLVITLSHDSEPEKGIWWVCNEGELKQKRLVNKHPSIMKILPRPPKMQISIPIPFDRFYTNESISMEVIITNGEDEEISEAALEIRLLGQAGELPKVSWIRHNFNAITTAPINSDDDRQEPARVELIGHFIGAMLPSQSIAGTLMFPAGSSPTEYVLELKMLYYLLSNQDCPVSKAMTWKIPIARPFEASYGFFPQLHSDVWPSLFLLPSTQPCDRYGLAQMWLLTTKIVSFATEDLIIEGMELPIHGTSGEVHCEIANKVFSKMKDLSIAPSDSRETFFLLDIQKLSLEDRRPAALNLALNIKWRRKGSDSIVNSSCLTIPRLLVLNGEPRVLASAHFPTSATPIIDLIYTLENPSMHFLTFSLAMEASEDFAFYGPKLSTLQLLPISRRTLRFTLMPYPAACGRWIQPLLHVEDRYFQKSLGIIVIRGSENIKVGGNGILIWVDPQL